MSKAKMNLGLLSILFIASAQTESNPTIVNGRNSCFFFFFFFFFNFAFYRVSQQMFDVKNHEIRLP